jgi:hypothetical protein
MGLDRLRLGERDVDDDIYNITIQISNGGVHLFLVWHAHTSRIRFFH